MDKELLSVTDFCKVTGISRALFYTLKKEGKAPALCKVGDRTLISRTAFEKWIAELEAASANNNRPATVGTAKQERGRK